MTRGVNGQLIYILVPSQYITGQREAVRASWGYTLVTLRQKALLCRHVTLGGDMSVSISTSFTLMLVRSECGHVHLDHGSSVARATGLTHQAVPLHV
ncbi:unnamed protein product [Fusarium graminearum]|uniref:Uncharacterized protein n=1 Tax=Gibberella zeae TaxID=5518 RepID=A0A4E9EES9_GIBZA|nr:unnamed protein product [Fusarium graminearum]CAG1959566.1 unnamed protein product [Fusarium graminearum]